jgi:Protein of unknown function (DUF2798)
VNCPVFVAIGITPCQSFEAVRRLHSILRGLTGLVCIGHGSCLPFVNAPVEVYMLRIPRRFSHFVFGFIQSGLTCAVAAAIASLPFLAGGTFVVHWLQSWLVAWIMMLPIVMFAAPAIRNLTDILTQED